MKNARILLLVLPLCLVFSFFLTNDTFAEVKDKVCKSLVAKADTAGEWSPAVTVCAGKNSEGKVVLVSLGLQEDYAKRGANTSGVATQVKIDVDDSAKPERGVVFRGNGNSGVINVGGLTGSATMGGSFKASDYSDPGKFASDVLSAGKDKVIQSSELVRVRHIPLRGGTTVARCTAVDNPSQCDKEFENGIYDNAIDNSPYSKSECEMVLVDSESKVSVDYSYTEYKYEVICGATPAHDETVKYNVYIKDEDNTVAEAATATQAADQQSTGGGEEEDAGCMGLGLSGQGWILCPTLENSAKTADGITMMIDSMLSVDSNLYNNDSGSYQAWEIFRNFANIILSIILLVIIFSQITGYGINNYGIKKMLPKFVVMAILINLSFVICQIAVDLSNILGSGLNGLFRTIGESIANSGGNGETLGLLTSTTALSDIVAGFIALLAGAGAAGGVVLPLVLGGVMEAPLVIICLILGILVALVSVLMFFVMLGARMVIIITFIALAPLAFACYILPNTQGIFKKWWSVLKVALVVYPICGALYGISFVIKAIFANTGDIDLWEGVVLLIAPFLPFLALPTLLKGALSGLGTIGGALTSIGNGVRRGISSGSDAIKNTEAYKRQQQEGARLLQQRNAEKGLDRYQRRVREAQAGGKPITEREKLRAARYQEQSDRLKRENYAAGALLAEQEAEGWDLSRMTEEWELAYASGDEGRLRDLTTVAQRKFGSGAANMIGKVMNKSGGEMLDGNGNVMLDENGNVMHESDNRLVVDGVRNDRIARSLAVLNDMQTHDSSFNSLMSSKATDAFDMISTMGRDGGQLHNLSHFSNAGGLEGNPGYGGRNATKLSDWNTQSGATLSRSVGTMSDSTLEGLAFSDAPDLKQGIQSDAEKIKHVHSELARRYGIDTTGMSDAQIASAVKQAYSSREGSSVSAGGGSAPVSDGAASASTGDTLRMSSPSGEHTLSRQADGRWVDENGNDMGGNFSARIENDAQLRQQVRENARKDEMYRNMSDERILELATNPNPQSQRIQDSAAREAERRGLNK